MPYCPRCRFEYDISELVCPECREVLVDQLTTNHSAAAVRPDDSWVVIAGISGPTESRLAKGSLDSNNIPAIVLPSNLTALGTGAPLLDGYRPRSREEEHIMVPREFQEEAVMVLKTVLGEDFSDEEVERR